MPNLNVNLCGLKLPNPLILASGIVGISRASLSYAVKGGAAAVTTKSLSVEMRKGHPAPIILTYPGGMLNSVGYSNPGIDNVTDEYGDTKSVGAPVIGSLTGRNLDDYVTLTEKAEALDFAAIELVLSCPHTPGYGTMAGLSTPEQTEVITKAARTRTKKPLFVKLSPNVMGITELAKAAEAGGADAITAVNTGGPGMLIDIRSRKPILGGKIGGLSGDALRPIAVRCVYDIYAAVKIPIIGTGGILNGEHAAEMLLAGATALGVGTAVYYHGIGAFKKICAELSAFMESEGLTDLSQLCGGAHAA